MCADFACKRPALHPHELLVPLKKIVLIGGLANDTELPIVLASLPALRVFVADIMVLAAGALPLPDNFGSKQIRNKNNEADDAESASLDHRAW